jgi:hypothetical protein
MGKKAEKRMRKLAEKMEMYCDSVVENQSCITKNLNERVANVANALRTVAPASQRMNILSEAFDAVQVAIAELHDHEATVVNSIM